MARKLKDGQELALLLHANEMIRDYVKDKYPIQYACVLLEILILQEGKQLKDLEVATGLSSSATQRAVSTLAERDWRGGQGAGLVELRVSPEDSRYRNIYLTAKGRRLREKLIGAMNGGS